ncbi:MAG TPA: alkaline phosphatase family protein [Jatrophihabitans sp.]|nr:alkaline phosphatase family protein [Jatrophihabitans sp.]
MIAYRLPLRITVLAVAAVVAAALVNAGRARYATATSAVPRPDHVVVVVMENHSNSDVIGNSAAPYINSLAAAGANFTQSYAITHPSEPNYLALFSGSTQGVTDDSCPHTFSTANLGAELIANSLSFTGYSESMPYDGYTGCSSGTYARKHNPWVNFTNVPASSNRTLDAFPSDYSQLPTISFVVPNLDNDMHDGTVAQGDTWLHDHLDGYVQWAMTHNSLLVLTFDEDDNSSGNRIPTVFSGASVQAGNYSERIDHYTVLRTLEDAYDLPYAGASASATPITDIWSTSGGTPVPTPTTPVPTPTTPVPTPTTPVPTPSTSSPAPPPIPECVPAQLIVNSGFESGIAAPWTGSTEVVVHETDAEPAAGGSWMAWLGGPGGTQTDTLSQAVGIPAGCQTATLSFRLHIDTAERKPADTDTLTVTLRSPTGAVLATLGSYSNLDAAAGYQLHTFDLSDYAGTLLTVTFSASENSHRQTNFLLDRVLLNVS